MAKRGASLFGQIAIQKGFVTQEQLDDSLRVQEEKFPGVPLGLLMVKQGYLSLSEAQAISGFQDHILNQRSHNALLKRREYRFGAVIIEYGLATKEQVNECARLQAQQSAKGVEMRLGEIMVKKGYLTAEDVHTILTLQDKKILACRECKTQTNVAGYSPGAQVACAKCGAMLIVPPREAWIHADETVFLPGAAPESIVAREALAEAKASPARVAPFGKFDLLRELGSSRGARVYQAMERESRRVVALKVYEGAHPKEVQAALAGARAVQGIEHPSVARVIEVGEADGRSYIAMEQIEGRPLDAWLRDKRPTEDVVRLVRGVAEALDAAHRAGVVHCDVKPSNILVDESGRPHLTDFGLARRSDAEVEQGMFGTPAYMAPEQAAGEAARLTPATDAWALGVVLYQALTGKLPFESPDPAEALRRVREDEPARPSSLSGDVSPQIEEVILRALAKDPARRYASAGAMAQDLARLQIGHTVAPRPREGITRRMIRATKKRPLLTLGVALVIVALLALFFSLWLRQ